MNMLSIYNNFVLVNDHSSKNPTQKILSKTKELTVYSKKYSKYIESFSEISQEKIYELKTDYDLPVITPKKLRKKNKSFSKKRKTFTPKMNDKMGKIINISNYNKKNLSNRNLPKKNKNINFFICDFDYSNIEEQKNNVKQNNSQNKFCLTQQNFINKYKNKYSRLYGVRNNYEKYRETEKRLNTNNEKSSKKQIFCLLDSVFSENKDNDIKDQDLIYEEKEIFGYKDIYLEYLKNELTSLINNKKSINMKSNISYNYNNKIYGKIIMELNSAKIEVFNKINDTISCTVNIPFNMLCLFYLSTVKQLSQIILDIFKNDFLLNEKLSNEEIQQIFENIFQTQISFDGDVLMFKNNFEDHDKKNIITDYFNFRNLKYRTNVRYNILSLNKREETLKKINFENCTYNNFRNSIFNSNFNYEIPMEDQESMKNLFDSNINIVNLSWITHDKNYLIRIKMPRISIKLPNYKKQINHFVNKEIFFFLYKNNFNNWNFYLSHYLFTLKKFRTYINIILSYYTLFNSVRMNNFKNHNISNLKLDTTKPQHFKGGLDTNKNMEKNIIYEKYNLSNLKTEQYENSINDNEYIFFVSDDEYIHLYKMKSYVLFAYSASDMKNQKIYYFDFSFFQMKILFYKSKYEDLIQFLQRLIKVNKKKKKIFLDYFYFNSFKSMDNKQIDYHFKESYLIENLNKNNLIVDNTKKTNTTSIASDTVNKFAEKEIILKISNPKFISVSIKKTKDINNINNKEKWVKQEGEIGRNLIEKLVETDIKKWGNILWQNKDKIEALKNSKSSGGRRNNIFKNKKDFKAVFKKFLKIK